MIYLIKLIIILAFIALIYSLFKQYRRQSLIEESKSRYKDAQAVKQAKAIDRQTNEIDEESANV